MRDIQVSWVDVLKSCADCEEYSSMNCTGFPKMFWIFQNVDRGANELGPAQEEQRQLMREAAEQGRHQCVVMNCFRMGRGLKSIA